MYNKTTCTDLHVQMHFVWAIVNTQTQIMDSVTMLYCFLNPPNKVQFHPAYLFAGLSFQMSCNRNLKKSFKVRYMVSETTEAVSTSKTDDEKPNKGKTDKKRKKFKDDRPTHGAGKKSRQQKGRYMDARVK